MLDMIGHRGLPSVGLQDLATYPAAHCGRHAEGDPVVGCRLAMGAEMGSPVGSRPGKPERRRVSGGNGVASQDGGIGALPLQGTQRSQVQHHPLRRGAGFGHRQLGKLVSKAQAVTIAHQHASGDALGDGRGLAGSHLLNQLRVIFVHLVVAIGAHHQGAHTPHPPAEHPEQIERGIVGPVQVLENDHIAGVRLEDQRQHRIEDAVAIAGGQGRLERTSDLLGDVDERGERSRRDNRVAPTPPEAVHPGSIGTEGLHQGGLADTGLADDQGDVASGAASRVQQPGQLRQYGGSLQNLQQADARRRPPGGSAPSVGRLRHR